MTDKHIEVGLGRERVPFPHSAVIAVPARSCHTLRTSAPLAVRKTLTVRAQLALGLVSWLELSPMTRDAAVCSVGGRNALSRTGRGLSPRCFKFALQCLESFLYFDHGLQSRG